MGSAAMSVSESLNNSQLSSPPCFLAATLNLLGEGFNPFEFLSTHQKTFMDSYNQLLEEWDTMDWKAVSPFVESLRCSDEVRAVFQRLKAHCEATKEPNKVSSFFTEKVLENDNKLTDHRINLITMAMRPHQLVGNEGRDSPPQWTLLSPTATVDTQPWMIELQSLLQNGGEAYAKDPNMAVWDLCCGILATRQPEPYSSICMTTHLNPVNETGGEVFFHAATKTTEYPIPSSDQGPMPLILGLLEWPVQVTKEHAFLDTCGRHNLNVTLGCKGSQVALATSSFLGKPLLLTKHDVDKEGVLDTSVIMSDVLSELENLTNEKFPKKDRDGLIKTTAFKTLACLVPISTLSQTQNTAVACACPAKWLVCVVVHAKEPKTALSVRALAMFIHQMIIRAQACAPAAVSAVYPQNHTPLDFSNYVAMSDTNVASVQIASVFRDQLGALALEASPTDPKVATTRKRRSKLHGQTYDTRKCHVTVTAPKDCIVTAKGALIHSNAAENVFPNINGDTDSLNASESGARTLPDIGWVSDHCIVTSAVAITEDPALTSDCLPDISKLICSSS